MNPDLDILATTLYVTVDDLLIRNPHWAPERPAVGIAPKLSGAELVTLRLTRFGGHSMTWDCSLRGVFRECRRQERRTRRSSERRWSACQGRPHAR